MSHHRERHKNQNNIKKVLFIVKENVQWPYDLLSKTKKTTDTKSYAKILELFLVL